MRFTKLQSVGNDFVLIEAFDKQADWPALSQKICDRHFGIGADGLLVLLKSDRADFCMRIFNPNSSEAEACGNGLRCLVHYILEKGLSGQGSLSIETCAGVRKANTLIEGGKRWIRIDMGCPILEPDKIPVIPEPGLGRFTAGMLGSYPFRHRKQELLLNFVSMGNPHAVFLTEDSVNAFPLQLTGPDVEHSSIFPRKTNFEVARILGRDSIEMRVWERGVGETLACGSGSCAVTIVASKLGLIDNIVDIMLPGGHLKAEWDRENEIYLSGRADFVFEGEWIRD